MFCWNCGKEIEDGSKFCMYCGTVLVQDDAAPAAPEAPKAAAPRPIEDERDTIWGRGEPKAQPDYSRPQPRDDGGYDRPAAPRPRANVQFNTANLDMILTYLGAALVIISSFLPFIGASGTGAYDVSLTSKSYAHAGIMLIVLAAMAAISFYLKQNFTFFVMVGCTIIHWIIQMTVAG
ncbi:MAG: zinc ribbon domain-containing protein, partial [Lachnospiraceae bacterium]|nr:zinc ribbon domain-containing protein [Lachnospiraceae bacterium]